MDKKSSFAVLNAINVNEHTEEKNKLTYLSWAWAWAEVKKAYPGSYYTIYENTQGLNYHTDGRTCWVKTGLTVVDGNEALEHIEYLPVMDYRNVSIPLEKVTSMDVNKAIQRSLTKAAARHGLGLYIYAGEDLPQNDMQAEQKPIEVKSRQVTAKAEEKPNQAAVKKEYTNRELLDKFAGRYNVRETEVIERLHALHDEGKLFRGNYLDMTSNELIDALTMLGKELKAVAS